MQTDEFASLMEVISTWSRPAKGFHFYVFGSRVRGDHKPGSDVDLHFRFDQDVDDAAGEWWIQQNDTDFATLKKSLLHCMCSLILRTWLVG